MSNLSKNDKERQKLLQEKCQTALNIMLRDEDNKYCVDCDAKGPRWASWNLGVFLCIRCAGIHRNLGVHISKVKSVNLDSWTPEQVVSMQQMGNSRARAVYEANLPDSFRRPQNDSAIEQFVRQKYEHKKYIAREYVPSALPKVDWEAEIEAELRRKKEKKKGDSTPPPVKVEMPAKVTIADKVPTPPSKPKVKSNEPRNNSADDLLGLDVGTVSAPAAPTSRSANLEDDIFGVFVNANTSSVEPQPPAAQAPSTTQEESDFFNQPLGEKKPMDKDSILALYAKSTPQVNTAFGQQMPTGVPQGFGYGAPGMLPNQAPYGVPGVANQGMIQSQQAFGGMGVSSQFGIQSSVSLQNSAFSGLPVPAMGANPFMQNQVAQLQSQMAGVSIGPGLTQTQQGASHFGNGFAFPNGLVQQTNGQTLSNNLWQ